MPADHEPTAAAGADRSDAPPRRVLITAAVVVLAANLRPPVNSIGAVVPELQAATGLSAAAVGVLLALPTLSFGLVGPAAPGLARRTGPHNTVLIALAAITAGQLVRAAVSGFVPLFVGSALALAGVAAANVLMPALVRLHFPDRILLMTAIYTTLLSAGGAVGSGITIPIEHALGGNWQIGIGSWSVLSAVALLVWWPLRSAARPARRSSTAVPSLRSLRHTRLAWVMAGYFGTQSLQAYVMFGWLPTILTDAGVSQSAAAGFVSVIALVGTLISPIVPLLLGRLPSLALICGLSAGYLAGYACLLISPATLAWPASIAIGIGTGAFPVALTLIALRSRTAVGTTALSAFTQSVGYLLASVGPVLFGVLHDLTGSWTVPLIALIVLVVVHLVFGVGAARRRFIEDELRADAAS